MTTATATVETIVPRRRDRRWPPLLPLAIVIVLVLCGLLAPWLAPRSPLEGSLGERLAAPFGMENSKPGHPLGTDRHGRDTLSRLLYGARISLAVSVVGITLTGAVGSFIGLLAGFIYVMIVSIRELSSSILLYSPGTEVVSIMIWELWQNGQYVELSALGVMLIVALFFLVMLAQLASRRFGIAET